MNKLGVYGTGLGVPLPARTPSRPPARVHGASQLAAHPPLGLALLLAAISLLSGLPAQGWCPYAPHAFPPEPAPPPRAWAPLSWQQPHFWIWPFGSFL